MLSFNYPEYHNAECHYSKCHIAERKRIMQSVVILNAIGMSIHETSLIRLRGIRLSIVGL